MAKPCQLKEIISLEAVNSGLKPVEDQSKDEIETRKFSRGRIFFDELTLWKTALQIEAVRSNG